MHAGWMSACGGAIRSANSLTPSWLVGWLVGSPVGARWRMRKKIVATNVRVTRMKYMIYLSLLASLITPTSFWPHCPISRFRLLAAYLNKFPFAPVLPLITPSGSLAHQALRSKHRRLLPEAAVGMGAGTEQTSRAEPDAQKSICASLDFPRDITNTHTRHSRTARSHTRTRNHACCRTLSDDRLGCCNAWRWVQSGVCLNSEVM